jgi:hypothetical protein
MSWGESMDLPDLHPEATFRLLKPCACVPLAASMQRAKDTDIAFQWLRRCWMLGGRFTMVYPQFMANFPRENDDLP